MTQISSRASGNLDTSVPVVVLKTHHGSLGIARSLGRLGVDVYGIAASPNEPSTLSRYWRACYHWNLDSATAERSVEYFLELGRQLGRRAILIPVSDRTAMFVAEHAEALRQAYLFRALSPELIRTLTSKKGMYALVKKLGIPTAETLFPSSRTDVVRFLDSAVFPVMLKANDGVLLFARTGRKMAIVRNAAELLDYYDRWEDPDNPNLMLQEYIPGADDTVWMFNGYFNTASDCLVGFTGKKIRQNPVSMGSTSLGICLPNDVVYKTTLKFMKAVGYQGILDIGYRYDARDGKYKVLDVNCRIGSTFRLFVDSNGLDVVRALYCDITGQPVPAAASTEGRKWVAEDLDVESFYQSWRAGRIGILQWIWSFRGVREGAWFALDDLRPFAAVCRIYFASFARLVRRSLQPALLRVLQRAGWAKPRSCAPLRPPGDA